MWRRVNIPLKKENYKESIVYFSRDNTRSGQTLSFKYDQKDNDWHHTGFSSKGKPLHEIWTLRKKRIVETVSELLKILRLKRISETKFVGQNYPASWGRVFGGQILAQSLHAAYQTVPNTRIAHSLHGYFILMGDINLPVEYEVDKIRDGNSFTTRRVVAYQNGKAIFNMAASFQKEENGVDHQIDAPNILPPEVLRSDMQQVESIKHKNPNYYKSLKKAQLKMFDIRPVENNVSYRNKKYYSL